MTPVSNPTNSLFEQYYLELLSGEIIRNRGADHTASDHNNIRITRQHAMLLLILGHQRHLNHVPNVFFEIFFGSALFDLPHIEHIHVV